jgi:cytochrome c-type biogenesis protein CcmH
MTLWFVIAIMTAAAAFAVIWPLGRSVATQREGAESNVYKDQLAEVDRDAAIGLIGAAEASAAKVEISRRLLASAETERASSSTAQTGTRRAVAVFALIGLPVLALGVYLLLGSPMQADLPLQARKAPPPATQPLENLVAQVEAHLEKAPNDGRGWTVLAPVLAKLGRFEAAVRAYRNSLQFAGDNAERRADLGEVLVGASGGVITDDAKAEFEKANKLDPNETKSNYFLGLAAEQEGRPKDAAAIWRAMLDRAAADAPWRPMLQQQIARLEGAAVPALPDEKLASAEGMSAADRDGMIRGMVDKLAARLKTNGDDVEGWLRLVRSYLVLGDTENAKIATAQARQANSGNAERLKQLNDGLKNLGLGG